MASHDYKAEGAAKASHGYSLEIMLSKANRYFQTRL